MARRDDCASFAKKNGLKMITIAALIEYFKSQDQINGNVL